MDTSTAPSVEARIAYSALPDSPAPFSTVTAAHANIAVTNAIIGAKSLPDIVNKLQVVDPELAEQIEGKALIYSKTMWGGILTPVLTALVAKFGLGWDANTILLVEGAIVSIGTVVFRYLTTSPIAGILSKAATPAEQAAVSPSAKVAVP